jgi:hypothetical protein
MVTLNATNVRSVFCIVFRVGILRFVAGNGTIE